MTRHARSRDSDGGKNQGRGWHLCLFVAGRDAASAQVQDKLERICREYLDGGYRLEVVDIKQDPARADAFDIIVTPTVVRYGPPPERRVIGDLSLTGRVLSGLGFPARSTNPVQDP